MTTNGADDQHEPLGELSDDQEAQEESSTTGGAAAEGEYDPAQGSPEGGGTHPVGETFPDEVDRNGEPIGD